jgi:hypothetical protein
VSETTEELSRDRRFVLVRLHDNAGGVPRQRVRLDLAHSRACVLDLSDPGCRADVGTLDAGGRALLHLRLSRLDGSVVMYPATLDLDTGLYYHGDPRHTHAPAGQAADLEAIARGDGPPPEFDRARHVRWPDAGQLAREVLPMPEPVQPEPVADVPVPESVTEPQQSSDGRWRLESWTFEDGHEGYRGHARIVDTVNHTVVFDLNGSNWYSRGEFNPGACQLTLDLLHADGRQRLFVFIDLDCLLYWDVESIKNLTLNKMPASLAQLQQRLMAPAPREKPRLHLVSASPAAPTARSVTSPDGRCRVDLFPSGRSERNARGELKHYYHALFTDIECGKIIADTRQSKELAWLGNEDGLTMSLLGSPSADTWVEIDLRSGVCWRAHFRGPLSEDLPLQQLREMLAR